jgi:hypothetical protein
MFLWWLAFGNGALLGLSAMLLWYNGRRLRRIIVLDRLLQNLCVESCQRTTQPVWKAWAQTIGAISVKIESRRIHLGED